VKGRPADTADAFLLVAMEGVMLILEATKLSETELTEAIADHCFRYGTVLAVKIFPPINGRDYYLAAVTMSTPAEAAAIVDELGSVKFKATAIVRVEQVAKATSAPLA
jgi:hypothetical protein